MSKMTNDRHTNSLESFLAMCWGVSKRIRAPWRNFTFSEFTLLDFFLKKPNFFGLKFSKFFFSKFSISKSKNFFCLNFSGDLPTLQKSYSEHWKSRFLCLWTYLGQSLNVAGIAFLWKFEKSVFTKIAISLKPGAHYYGT